jgi:beta-glucosidase
MASNHANNGNGNGGVNGNGTHLRFPANFVWGAATSTTQVEGHVVNEWTDFVARDGNTCRIACDSYHRYAEDVEWMVKLGVKGYRMGVEWSRLQSEAGAPLNERELARYCDHLDQLRAAGIEPMVVLHHFSNPAWISSKGGWVNPAAIPAFIDYATKLVAALRSRVRVWNTFNEPDTYATCGYLIGEFPPLKKLRLNSFRKVIQNMADAHVQVCKLIRQAGSDLGPVEVGFSKNWTYFEPHHRFSPWDHLMAALSHHALNRFVLKSFLGGDRKDASTYLGVNYYGRIRYRHCLPLVPTFGYTHKQLSAMGVECDDMLERHPAGLEHVVHRMHRDYGLPIYVTEHGSASDDETFRERDLRENLMALHRAIGRGVDVRGFYYWSLLDNFEWQFGYTKKFGLIGVDFKDEKLPRTMKPLGQIYRTVCQENSIRY